MMSKEGEAGGFTTKVNATQLTFRHWKKPRPKRGKKKGMKKQEPEALVRLYKLTLWTRSASDDVIASGITP